MKLPPPPPEPRPVTSTAGMAPLLCDKLKQLEGRMILRGWRIARRETFRTPERATWLYGFGRDYDDGRGIVTFAPTAFHTWHFYGLAADYGDARHEPGNEPAQFWADLRELAHSLGLACGADWRMKDMPHVQWGKPMRDSPSENAEDLFNAGGLEAVWKAVGAAL